MESADRFMKGLALPTMRTPEGFGQEYSFPSNAATLTSLELGSLQLKLRGFHSYSSVIIGREEAELTARESIFELAVGVRMQRLQEGTEKRLLKDALRAISVVEDPLLNNMQRRIIEQRARLRQLAAQVTIYTDQLASLSREQTRRSDELRSRLG